MLSLQQQTHGSIFLSLVQNFRLMKYKRKNKNFNPNNCGAIHFFNIVGGKWKVLVLHAINKEFNRFSLLRKHIPLISKQMLVNLLRELEDDLIIERKIYPEVPPRVEYQITEYGQDIMLLINIIQKWGGEI